MEYDLLLKELEPIADTQRIGELLNNLKKSDDLKLIEDSLNELQKICNTIYYKYGLSDAILELQVIINQTRYEYDITDRTEKTNSEGYVQ